MLHIMTFYDLTFCILQFKLCHFPPFSIITPISAHLKCRVCPYGRLLCSRGSGQAITCTWRRRHPTAMVDGHRCMQHRHAAAPTPRLPQWQRPTRLLHPHPAPVFGSHRCVLIVTIVAAQRLHASITHAKMCRDAPWRRGPCLCHFDAILLTVPEPSARELTAVSMLYLLTCRCRRRAPPSWPPRRLKRGGRRVAAKPTFHVG